MESDSRGHDGTRALLPPSARIWAKYAHRADAALAVGAGGFVHRGRALRVVGEVRSFRPAPNVLVLGDAVLVVVNPVQQQH